MPLYLPPMNLRLVDGRCLKLDAYRGESMLDAPFPTKQRPRTFFVLAVFIAVALMASAESDAGAQPVELAFSSSHRLGSESVRASESNPAPYRGVVMDDGGVPLPGAVVQLAEHTAITGFDGVFSVRQPTTNTGELSIEAAGHVTSQFELPLNSQATFQLAPITIKAIYTNGEILATSGGLESLVAIAESTEINAIVLDVKDTTIFFESQVPFFREIGSVSPLFDVQTALELLKAHGVYAIARIVVFQDPLVAEARPELAVHDDATGGLWRNDNGVARVNAFREELWGPNIELALEAIGLGFNEIQYDYVRFPSDGDLGTAEFGRDYTAAARETAITAFVTRSHDLIEPTGGKLAADLFGFVTIVDDEQYIGQRFSALAPYLDVICMMIYPSHFIEGNIASAPGHPNDYPYETILEALQRAEQNVPGSKVKFRPWLQDFSYPSPVLRGYSPADVKAQIDAAEEFGTAGWMLWGDPFNISVTALAIEQTM
ncbi:MAG: hypothetical protein M3R06_02930 [Chloroflexota bacterium]|nr:hypothetical protein [Chloroflexota bacterium]